MCFYAFVIVTFYETQCLILFCKCLLRNTQKGGPDDANGIYNFRRGTIFKQIMCNFGFLERNTLSLAKDDIER